MNDYRENYFNPPHEETHNVLTEPSEQHTGNPPINANGHRYDSELDRVTEQEMVPDIVERLTTRYDIEYNESSNKRRIFRIPGLNKIRVIKLIKQLFALIPRSMESDNINNADVIVVPIQSGDSSITFTIQGNTILRAYLSSSMIDICNSLTKSNNTYSFSPTIPFKQNDELIVYYR